MRGVELTSAASACRLQPNQQFHAPHCFQGNNEAELENNEAVRASECSCSCTGGWSFHRNI